ncbi:hypothetical protein [Chitinivorax sp. B]|uniref:hypothetical protein n=1 Tax=Chitinivorax sp. B TaxID=2502235 RepID=UPI0010F4B5F6|nr:hypothetical protein [Chitinivorax sp. B]
MEKNNNQPIERNKSPRKKLDLVARRCLAVDPNEFHRLTFGMSDQEIGEVTGVCRQTAFRWRRNPHLIPSAVKQLLQYRAGTLPEAFGDFAGYQIGTDAQGNTVLIAPGQNWRDAITAKEAHANFFTRRRLERLETDSARLTIVEELLIQRQTELAAAQVRLEQQQEEIDRLRADKDLLRSVITAGLRLPSPERD